MTSSLKIKHSSRDDGEVPDIVRERILLKSKFHFPAFSICSSCQEMVNRSYFFSPLLLAIRKIVNLGIAPCRFPNILSVIHGNAEDAHIVDEKENRPSCSHIDP